MRSGGARGGGRGRATRAPHPKTDEAKATRRRGVSHAAPACRRSTRDLETLLEARRDEWSMQTDARAVRRARRGRGRAQEDRRSRAALAQPRRLPAAARHRRAARRVALARDVGRVQREPRVRQERAEPARVVDRVAADRGRPREGPAGSDLRSARAAAAAEPEAGEEARRGEAEQAGARRDVARGREHRALADRAQDQARRRADARGWSTPQGPRGRGAPVGAVAARRARAALRPAQRGRAAVARSTDVARARCSRGTGPSPTRSRSRSRSSARRTGDRTRDLDDATRAQARRRRCARCPAASARSCSSSRSSRSRRARSASRSATRCRRA